MDITQFNRDFQVRVTGFEQADGSSSAAVAGAAGLFRVEFTIVHPETGRAMRASDVVALPGEQPALEPSAEVAQAVWRKIAVSVRNWASRVAAGMSDVADAPPPPSMAPGDAK